MQQVPAVPGPMTIKTFFYTTKNAVSLLSEKIWQTWVRRRCHQWCSWYIRKKDPSYYIWSLLNQNQDILRDYLELVVHLVSWLSYFGCRQPFWWNFKPIYSQEETKHEYSIWSLRRQILHCTDQLGSATNFRLMETPTNATSAKENWTEVIAHRDDVLIEVMWKYSMTITWWSDERSKVVPTQVARDSAIRLVKTNTILNFDEACVYRLHQNYRESGFLILKFCVLVILHHWPHPTQPGLIITWIPLKKGTLLKQGSRGCRWT